MKNTFNSRSKKVIPVLYAVICCIFFSQCSKEDSSPGNNVSAYKHLRVIYHIIHNGQPVGTEPNMSSGKINSHLEKLNSVYKNLDIKVGFVLAAKNPSGSTLAEPGIDRIYRQDSIYNGSNFFNEPWVLNSMWNPDEYVNIWVCNTDEGKARSTYPYMPTAYPLAGMIVTDYYQTNSANYGEGLLFTPRWA